MDNIKIENFVREHPIALFPAFRTLTAQETGQIRSSIATQLGLPLNVAPLDLVLTVSEKTMAIHNSCAEDENFSLKSLLKELDIEVKGKIFINWYRFDNVDEISLDDLSHYFDDLWYPAADAIDVFDNTFGWILSINYSGNISLLKFQ